ncbi:MAG: hypothetical protein EOP06_31600, partial [Proteobacteria bacterium]
MKDKGQSFEELVALARVADELETEEGKVTQSEIISILSARADRETMDKVTSLIRGNVFERQFAIRVLGGFKEIQVKIESDYDYDYRYEIPFRAEKHKIYAEVLSRETESRVLIPLLLTMHYEEDAQIATAISSLRHHPDPEVRAKVTGQVFFLPQDEAIEMILELAEDEDKTVRQHAIFTFRITPMLDSPAVRAALVKGLEDTYTPVRLEAMSALVDRLDERAIPAILLDYFPETVFTVTEMYFSELAMFMISSL